MGRPSTSFVYPAVVGAGAAGANDLLIGMFAETIDNSANTATTLPVTVDFLKEKTLMYRTNDGTLTATSVFSPCYAADDSTASATSTNSAKLGTVLRLDSVLGVAFEVGGV